MFRALLAVRSHYGALDDGARFHVIARMIRETVNCGKLMLATSIVSRDDSLESGSSTKDGSTIHNLIQKDRVLSAVRTMLYNLIFCTLELGHSGEYMHESCEFCYFSHHGRFVVLRKKILFLFSVVSLPFFCISYSLDWLLVEVFKFHLCIFVPGSCHTCWFVTNRMFDLYYENKLLKEVDKIPASKF